MLLKNTFGLNTTEEHKISGIEQPAYRKWKPTNSTRTYNTLPDFIKTHFDSNIHVVVYKVVEASLTDLCELFININDGVTLNPQEKRNAIVCKLASIVRELSQDFEKFFSIINNNKDTNKKQWTIKPTKINRLRFWTSKTQHRSSPHL